MNVEIVFADEGARRASDERAVAIIVDALRASATAVTALALGARAVIPVANSDEAGTYVGRDGFRVAGERNARKCEGFDYGNSPTELISHAAALEGHTLVISTTNGTRIIEGARGAAALFVGTTLNAAAVARDALARARELERPILIVMAGEDGKYAEEDAYAAQLIARSLAALGAAYHNGHLPDATAEEIFAATPSAQELRNLGYEQDIAYCAGINRYDVAPMLDGGELVRSSD